MLQAKDSLDLRLLNPMTLAFVGDGVYELLVREHLASFGAMPVKKLHLLAVEFVRAKAQSAAVEVVAPLLTPQEEAVYKRGRNATGVHAPKNTDLMDYRRATGLEALFGWLYLSGETARIEELFAKILEAAPASEEGEEGLW